MKYFTYELWNKLNSENEEEREKANNVWKSADEKYDIEFNKIKNEISLGSLKVYYNCKGFHDFSLVKFELNQNEQSRNHINVRLEVFSHEFGSYELIYSGVERFGLIFDRDEMPEFYKMPQLDTWGYDEFLRVENKILSHEILFVSGATILIHFRRIKIKKLNERKSF